MTSAIISPETKDTTTSLTVTVKRLSISSSPFPSPGSPFLPPPILSPHEYAVMSSTSKRRSTDSRMNAGNNTCNSHEPAPPSAPQNYPAAPTVTGAGLVAGKPSGATTAESQDKKSAAGDDKKDKGTDNCGRGADLDATSRSNVNGGVGAGLVPASPPTLLVSESVLRPGSSSQSPSAGSNGVAKVIDNDGVPLSESPPATPLASNQNPPTTIISPPSASSSSTVPTDSAKSSSLDGLRSSRDSLTSSRPAPPSPAASRRTSAALSRQSSSRSRPNSTSAFSAAPADPHEPEPESTADTNSATSPTTPTPAQLQQQQQQARKSTSLAPATASVLVKIRDYAFPDEDVRHTGTGPLTPRPNRRLQRPLSSWSASSASSTSSNDDGDDPSSSGGGSGGGTSYGFAGWGLGRLSWFGVRGDGATAADGGGSGGPSQGDFERNFEDAVSPSYEIDDPYASLDDDDDFDDYEDGDGFVGDQGEEDVERPLLPGMYRALYTFEPEGTAEMALEEDQIVRVVGRGGGVGWAIVARGGDEGHALVPEGYLELVSLDREQLGEEDG